MDILSIISIIAIVLALGLSFYRYIPSACAAYAAIICAHFGDVGGQITISADSLLFWGVAAVIVLGLALLNTDNPVITTISRSYSIIGAICGGLLGFVSSHTAATVIVGSTLGAVLGAFAFSRTPAGAAARADRHLFVDYVCATGLPAVVITGMCGVALSAILF